MGERPDLGEDLDACDRLMETSYCRMRDRAEAAEKDRDRALLAMRRFAELEHERLSLCCMKNLKGLDPDEDERLCDVARAWSVAVHCFEDGDVEAALKAMEVEDE